MKFQYVVVGAGLAGITMAERIATQLHEKVLVIEKRGRIGGNVYDEYDDAGILVQRYGPHTFHTDDREVFDYVCQYCRWHPYEHRALSWVDGRFVPFPISLETVNQLYGLNLTEEELPAFLDARRIRIGEIRSSEDLVLDRVGRDLYEKFFRNFTIKQWGVDPSRLDPSVIGRIPFRMNRDTRYFTDRYQGNPAGGFTGMCRNMLSHPEIEVLLNTDYRDVIRDLDYGTLIYTGPLDAYFGYRFGRLRYRSIRFRFETYGCESYQPAPSTRWPGSEEYTRITEFKKMTGQESSRTTILKEIPCDGEEPFYPMPTPEWKALAERYRALAAQEENVLFLGRLAEYRYYNMDDVIRRALDLFRDRIWKEPPCRM